MGKRMHLRRSVVDRIRARAAEGLKIGQVQFFFLSLTPISEKRTSSSPRRSFESYLQLQSPFLISCLFFYTPPRLYGFEINPNPRPGPATAATMASLIELDSLTTQVIIDNELDPISPSPSSLVNQTGGMRTIAINGPTPADRAGAVKELRMDHICCSAHGLSLLITGVKDGEERTVLFDTGPEEHAFERNAKRLGVDLGRVEVVQLSHWHRDHSGGMLKAVGMIKAAKSRDQNPVTVDLHPARPMYRGNQAPEFPVVSLEADPSFSEIEAAGGKVAKSDQPHSICDDFFTVSGEIPRVTEYEKGLKFGMRMDSLDEGWKKDEQMADERFLMCRLKGEPIVSSHVLLLTGFGG